MHTYGEYIGGIAQQFDFQSALRLSPFPFTYGTFQMMLKDGGVCGTMANIAVRSYLTLGALPLPAVRRVDRDRSRQLWQMQQLRRRRR